MLWEYLITRFLFMIAHTRQFPTTPTTTNMESIVVIATPADPDMMKECQRTYLVIWISKQNDSTRDDSGYTKLGLFLIYLFSQGHPI